MTKYKVVAIVMHKNGIAVQYQKLAHHRSTNQIAAVFC
jgi:hypothetical protein